MDKSDRVKLFNELSRERKANFVKRICAPCENLMWFDEKRYFWCRAFNSFHFLWGKGECPARIVDASSLAKECFAEDQHKELLKPGGGEKSDRTHKIFSRERMKDNRAPLWDGDLS